MQRVDQRVVDQAVHLQPDMRRLAGPREGDLVSYAAEQSIARGQRAEPQRIHAGGLSIAGHVVEQSCRVAAEIRIGSEE
jgi:hypothetical protein